MLYYGRLQFAALLLRLSWKRGQSTLHVINIIGEKAKLHERERERVSAFLSLSPYSKRIPIFCGAIINLSSPAQASERERKRERERERMSAIGIKFPDNY